MRKAVQGLAGGAAAWDRFLTFNERMSETIDREADELGIGVFKRDSDVSLEGLAGAVIQGLGI
jgi:hypothetical protein